MGIVRGHLGHDLQSIYCTIFCQFCIKVVPRLSEHGDVTETHVTYQTSAMTGAPKFFAQGPPSC